MSAVSESISQRMTLGMLAERYGWLLEPSFACNVTVTSLADSVDAITPGALYLPSDGVNGERLRKAAAAGAYAAVVPSSVRADLPELDIPLLFGTPSAPQLGDLASEITGAPANVLAVFAVTASTPEESHALASSLAAFLHMLGNPVGLVSASGSRSLERVLDLTYPLGVLDVHRCMAVCAEDGAAAMVMALDDRTLSANCMCGIGVDVLGSDMPTGGIGILRERYGFATDDHVELVRRTSESDAMVRTMQTNERTANPRRMSLAIAMALAAGVRKANIRNALRVAQELR